MVTADAAPSFGAGGLRMRGVVGYSLPLAMIAATIMLQKYYASSGDEDDVNAVPFNSSALQREANIALINASCGWEHARLARKPGFSAPSTSKLGSPGARLLIGAGFPGSGLPALSALVAQLPGACTPQRADLGFWKSHGVSGRSGHHAGHHHSHHSSRHSSHHGSHHHANGSHHHSHRANSSHIGTAGTPAAATAPLPSHPLRSHHHSHHSHRHHANGSHHHSHRANFSRPQPSQPPQPPAPPRRNGHHRAGSTHGRILEARRRASHSLAAGFPADAATRQAYLRDGVRLGRNKCTLAWELSDGYAAPERGARGACVPLSIRHYFPSARVVLLFDDPVRRAYSHHVAWSRSHCARDAAKARHEDAPGTPAGCAVPSAHARLEIELGCIRRCALHPDSSFHDLLRCSSTCHKAVRAAVPGCGQSGGGCPPDVALAASHYALLLPLWTMALPCDQLLIARTDDFVGRTPTPATRAAGAPRPDGGTASDLSVGARRLIRLVGGTHANASRLARLRAAQLPPPVATEHLDGGPDAALRDRLAEYFAPFERRLAQQIAKRDTCARARRAKESKRGNMPVKFLPPRPAPAAAGPSKQTGSAKLKQPE